MSDELLEVLRPIFQQTGLAEGCCRLSVLTQTCDLVPRQRRNSEERACKASYICFAAMRPLTDVLRGEVARYQRDELEQINGLCKAEHRPKIEQFVERLLNNNAEGYFYFHDTGDHAIPEPMCAILSFSFVLGVEHYELCRGSREIGLKPEFQAKMGWLLGNSYSQVATEDWITRTIEPKPFRAMVESIARANFAWPDLVSLRDVKEAIRKGDVCADPTSIAAFLAGTPTWTQRLLTLIESELVQRPEFRGRPEEVQKVIRKIQKSPDVSRLMQTRD